MPTDLLLKPASGGAKRAVSSSVRTRRFGASLFVAAIVFAAMIVKQAWEHTVQREAYLSDLEVMAQHDKYNGSLLALLAGREAQSGQFAIAAANLKQAIAAGDSQADVWKTWAGASAAAGNQAEGVAILRLGLKSLRAQNDRADVQGALDRAMSLGSDSSPPQLAHAISPEGLDPMVARRTQGSFLNRIALWWGTRHMAQSGYATREELAKQRPNDAEVQRWWGLALVRNHRMQLAEATLRRAVELAPNDSESHFALAGLLQEIGASSKAGLEYETCLRLRHDWLPALIGLGDVALNKSLIALSVSVFQKATTVAPTSADAWIGMGRAYYSTHIQLGQAVSAFEQAVRLAPTRTDFFSDYYRTLRMTYKYELAETVIRQRLRAAPEESQSHFLLALLLRDYQPTPARLAESEQELRTSLRLTPHAEATEVELAQQQMQHGRPEEAVTLLNDALSQNELNVKAIRMLERAYRQAGTPALADKFQKDASGQIQLAQQLGDLEDLEHRNPGDEKVHAQLATLYTRIGRHIEAAQEVQFAAYLRAHPDAARHAIKTLDAATTISHPSAVP